ncbi:hypothetical protein NS220_11255 [Microbacterium testaceum]|uniref:Uncharacterized protein n=2 Tax=Micrococcales TaxID=85006 RepID=A0A147EW00_MICTE|nr:hypothetical protein NS220_11255 [Microbacterium testaceum]
MSHDQKPPSNKTVWAALGLLLIPVLCCTAPVLVGVGAVGVLGLVGAAANNVWVSVVAALIAISVVGWLLHRWWVRKGLSSGVDDCCEPGGPVVHEKQLAEDLSLEAHRVNDGEGRR